MEAERLPRKLAAILYADVAGYSRLTGEDEDATHHRLSKSLDLISSTVQINGGRVMHYAGDAVLAMFEAVSDALSSAVQIQHALQLGNEDLPENRRVLFRVGVNLGDVIEDRDDIYGDGVNVAARLESLAEPGGICVSDSVRTAIGRRLPLDYEDLGEQWVKNINEPVRTYHARLRPGAELPEPRAAGKPASKAKRVTVIVGIAALVVMLSAIWIASKESFDESELLDPMAPSTPERLSIAVLPFANMSSNPEEEYFADGMTDDLITDLSKISGLLVIARNSVFTYKGKAIKVQQVGRELGVRYVLEGSVRRAGGRIRINAQLIDASTGRHLWAERYDRAYEDIFALQDEVIEQVVAATAVELSESEQSRIARLPTDNLEAYDYYLRAERNLYVSDIDIFLETLSLYEKATTLDPDFADAHAGFARAAIEVWRLDYAEVLASAVARKRAYESAARALVLDADNARAFSVLAIVQVVDGQHEAAIESARKAVSVSPSSADAYLNFAVVLAYSGRPSEARAAVETALRLEPKPSSGALVLAGIGFFADRKLERAVEAFEQARDARPADETARLYLAAAYAHLDSARAARAEIDALLVLLPFANLTYYGVRDRYYKRNEDLAWYLDGLRKAGLPQWPFNFRGRDQDRLDAITLKALVYGHTWKGRHANGAAFLQQIDLRGIFAYRSRTSFFTGKAEVRDDRLCQRFDGTTLNRWLCGHVYRNPGGTRKDHDEYVSVTPDALKYFSAVQ